MTARLLGVSLNLWGPQTTEQLGRRLGELGLTIIDNGRIEHPTWAFCGEAPATVDAATPLDQAVALGIGQIVAAVDGLTPAERAWLADCRLRKVQIGVAFPADTVRSVQFNLTPNLSARIAAAGLETTFRIFPEPLGNIDAMNMPSVWARKMRAR